jgi:hypothetical protein
VFGGVRADGNHVGTAQCGAKPRVCGFGDAECHMQRDIVHEENKKEDSARGCGFCPADAFAMQDK